MSKPVSIILSVIIGATFATLARAQAHYRHDGPALLPDPAYTPGVALPMSTAQVCATKWGVNERHVTPAMKAEACAEYGVSDCPGKKQELDHLISRELGGADNLRNLWPEPYLPAPGAHQKDQVENWLHRQVCAQDISLHDAQKDIAADWYKVYLRMLAEEK